MPTHRILFYIKVVSIIIISLLPLALTVNWWWGEHGYKIDWKPFIDICIFVLIGLISIVGIVFSCIGVQSLHKEIKADLRDRKLKKEGKTLCRTCYGGGCRKCNQQGHTDWISDIVGVKNNFSNTMPGN